MNENQTNKPSSEVSAKVIERNQKNSQKSTGPTSQAGKAKASANSYKHGFFAKHLFLPTERAPKDQDDYLAVAQGLRDEYEPVGYLENLLVEKIATESLRAARLLAHEQRMLNWNSPFESQAMNNLQRYETSINRELARAMDKLERLQAQRKAAEGQEEEAEANPSEGEEARPDSPESGPEGLDAEGTSRDEEPPATSEGE